MTGKPLKSKSIPQSLPHRSDIPSWARTFLNRGMAPNQPLPRLDIRDISYFLKNQDLFCEEKQKPGVFKNFGLKTKFLGFLLFLQESNHEASSRLEFDSKVRKYFQDEVWGKFADSAINAVFSRPKKFSGMTTAMLHTRFFNEEAIPDNVFKFLEVFKKTEEVRKNVRGESSFDQALRVLAISPNAHKIEETFGLEFEKLSIEQRKLFVDLVMCILVSVDQIAESGTMFDNPVNPKIRYSIEFFSEENLNRLVSAISNGIKFDLIKLPAGKYSLNSSLNIFYQQTHSMEFIFDVGSEKHTRKAMAAALEMLVFGTEFEGIGGDVLIDILGVEI